MVIATLVFHLLVIRISWSVAYHHAQAIPEGSSKESLEKTATKQPTYLTEHAQRLRRISDQKRPRDQESATGFLEHALLS